MTSLASERCVNHPGREAVARCAKCRRNFCRECVSEHESVIICGSCLRRVGSANAPRRGAVRLTLRLILPFAGGLTLWLVFYVLGRLFLWLVQAVS